MSGTAPVPRLGSLRLGHEAELESLLPVFPWQPETKPLGWKSPAPEFSQLKKGADAFSEP